MGCPAWCSGGRRALDCRVLTLPGARSGLTRNPPSLGFEPRTSCIRGPILSQLHYRGHWAPRAFLWPVSLPRAFISLPGPWPRFFSQMANLTKRGGHSGNSAPGGSRQDFDVETKTTTQPSFIGPADCSSHCNCNRKLSQNLCQNRTTCGCCGYIQLVLWMKPGMHYYYY